MTLFKLKVEESKNLTSFNSYNVLQNHINLWDHIWVILYIGLDPIIYLGYDNTNRSDRLRIKKPK